MSDYTPQKDYLESAEQICQGDIPCVLEWNKLYEEGYNRNTSSLTHLNGLSGAPGETVGNYQQETPYGAQFKEVTVPKQGYEQNVLVRVEAPWLAQHQEKTFMNITKELNEPPVKTYRDLKLESVGTQQNETYKPIIYKTEHFSPIINKNGLLVTHKIIIIAIILVIMTLIYKI
jgi:hypothetical protein